MKKKNKQDETLKDVFVYSFLKKNFLCIRFVWKYLLAIPEYAFKSNISCSTLYLQTKYKQDEMLRDVSVLFSLLWPGCKGFFEVSLAVTYISSRV